MSQDARSESQLRWYQGLEPYCWLVLIVAALGWLFDTMDQNLFNLVRTPSIRDLLSSTIEDPQLLEEETGRLVVGSRLSFWWAGRWGDSSSVFWATGWVEPGR